MDFLISRFGNERRLIQGHMDRLLELHLVRSAQDVRGLRGLYDNVQAYVQSGTKVSRTRELRLKRIALPSAGGSPGFEITEKRMRVLLCLPTCALSRSSAARRLTRNRARGTASEIALTDMAPIKQEVTAAQLSDKLNWL